VHIVHHPIFVALSVVIACLGSWTALDLLRRVRAHAGRWRGAWLAASGIAMGLSIWAMHFIAMLGFNPGAEVRYRIGLTVLSLLLAIAATSFAFFSVKEHDLRRLLAGGAVMGAGICVMHYVGMAAVITTARLSNDGVYVALAFIVAVTASTGALIAATGERTFLQRSLAAVVLGFAIVGMHYTAMFGVRLTPIAEVADVTAGGIDSITLAFAVAGGTMLILFLALIAALSDRRFEALAAREALRSEQQMRAIIEHLPLGVFVAAAPSGEIRFANDEAEKLLGRSLGREPFWDQAGECGAVHGDGRRLAPQEHALYQAMHESRRIGPRLQTYRRSDGSLAQFEVMAAPIPDRAGGSALAVVAFQDVTAKLLAEEEARQAAALRDSEERFRHIAEQAPVMLWISDAAGRHVYINKALRDFWGAPQDGRDLDWNGMLVDADRGKFLEQFDAALRECRGFAAEARFRRADGLARIVQVSASARFNNWRDFLGLIGVLVDVTEIRQAQTDLLHMNELLEERVMAALAEKAQAQAALTHVQRLESLGRLTGGVAHDFNNLLTVVIGALDIILRHPENAERRIKLGEAALAAAKRGERLTAQLLAFARRQPLRFEACDLNDLIREGEPLIRRAAGDGLSLDLRLGATPALVRIDPAQFEAALLNLVVNAVDATPPGGEISVETQLRHLSSDEFPEIVSGRYFYLRVSDTGAGMTADVMNQIFEPFFTTKAPGKGTGLGLSQVYGFVRQSGGAIRVQSAPGQGTSFAVYLPVFKEGTQAKPAKRVGRKSGLALSVLLTEDDASVATITETMLKNLGHRVARAANGQQALATLRSGQHFDLLLSDVVMPGGMNGTELAREAVALRPELKILLSSGYAGESLDRALTEGAWPFLKKPYLQDDLDALLCAIFKDGDEALSSAAV
jgi:PAS domain S-box-containing protein